MPVPDNVRALVFDIGGTIFDWHHTIAREVDRLAGERGVTVDAPAFANTWRRGMFEVLTAVRSGELPWMNADEMHRRVLDDVAPQFPQLGLSDADLDALNRVWHRLDAWPDAPAAIAALRERYTVIVLTVLSWSIAVDSSKHAGISWDGILSCEFLDAYKPEPEAYQAGVRLLGLEPSQAMMVAAHPWDLEHAMAAGLYSAYVPRPGERGDAAEPPPTTMDGATVNAADFSDLVRQLTG